MSLICLNCVSDTALHKLLSGKTTDANCSYCKKSGLTIEMIDLAEIVDKYLREYCCFGEEIRRFDRDDDNVEYVQEGYPLNELLQEELEIEYEPAIDLEKILVEKDPANYGDGDSQFYDRFQNYERKRLSSFEYDEIWREFSDGIKHERRFFHETTRSKLELIFGIQNSAIASELPIIEVGRDTPIKDISRARRADSETEAEIFLDNPERELSAPESKKATAGRMNPAGIVMFYGALSENTAIAEIRPSVGSLAVVAQFKMTRKLRLLDLSRIGSGFTGSLFDPAYENRTARLQFLRSFHALIARPIQPCDELLEYLPTQAVAEYISSILNLDGILYASAQVGSIPDKEEVNYSGLSEEELKLYNVVLFGVVLDSLMYIENSARLVRVTGVNYRWSIDYGLSDD